MVKLTSIKTQLIIFLAAFAIYLPIRDKDAIFLLAALLAVALSVTFESAILYLKEKKFSITDSSIISGLIIGYVLSSNSPWWIFFLSCLLAISSKHLIRIQKKHLFNPAAFGLFLATILFGASLQWKATYMWHILAPFGIYFIYKIKKIELLLGYLVTALILFGVQAYIQKTPLFNIFGYLSYFYIFIMLIEPKTTPISTLGKLIFGIGLALLILILTEAGVRFDVELFALLIFNLTAPLLNKLSAQRRQAGC